jgi:hypothetical protein
VLAIALIVAFNASTTRLIQLYIIGVFVSFTLSQSGMVKHWLTLMRLNNNREALHRMRVSMTINAVGAVTTAVVLVIVLVTKFTHGAWIVVITMPLVFLLMTGIRRHYDAVAAELTPKPDGVLLPSRIHVIVLVSKLNTPALRALAYARASRPNTLTAVTVRTSDRETETLRRDWFELDVPVPLMILESSFRDVTRPVIDHIKHIRRQSPRDVVAVYIPEYVVGHWWEHFLHNQSALRLKTRLLFIPGLMVVNVPYQLGSAQLAQESQDDDPLPWPSTDSPPAVASTHVVK